MKILWNPDMQVLKNVILSTTYISKKFHQRVNHETTEKEYLSKTKH